MTSRERAEAILNRIAEIFRIYGWVPPDVCIPEIEKLMVGPTETVEITPKKGRARRDPSAS